VRGGPTQAGERLRKRDMTHVKKAVAKKTGGAQVYKRCRMERRIRRLQGVM
jgi:hypothetical protein